MSEHQTALANLFADCWKDDSLKARFLSEPAAVLAERNIHIPDGMKINVVENTSDTLNIIMPSGPDNSHTLSDEELTQAAGGGSYYSVCIPTTVCAQKPACQC